MLNPSNNWIPAAWAAGRPPGPVPPPLPPPASYTRPAPVIPDPGEPVFDTSHSVSYDISGRIKSIDGKTVTHGIDGRIESIGNERVLHYPLTRRLWTVGSNLVSYDTSGKASFRRS